MQSPLSLTVISSLTTSLNFTDYIFCLSPYLQNQVSSLSHLSFNFLRTRTSFILPGTAHIRFQPPLFISVNLNTCSSCVGFTLKILCGSLVLNQHSFFIYILTCLCKILSSYVSQQSDVNCMHFQHLFSDFLH